jgi:hypothetical protein
MCDDPLYGDSTLGILDKELLGDDPVCRCLRLASAVGGRRVLAFRRVKRALDDGVTLDKVDECHATAEVRPTVWKYSEKCSDCDRKRMNVLDGFAVIMDYCRDNRGDILGVQILLGPTHGSEQGAVGIDRSSRWIEEVGRTGRVRS